MVMIQVYFTDHHLGMNIIPLLVQPLTKPHFFVTSISDLKHNFYLASYF